MLKTSLLGACLIVLAAACASTPPPAPRTAAAQAAGSSGSPLGCVNKTATRLPTGPDQCAGFGSTHSADAIRSTNRLRTSRPPEVQLPPGGGSTKPSDTALICSPSMRMLCSDLGCMSGSASKKPA